MQKMRDSSASGVCYFVSASLLIIVKIAVLDFVVSRGPTFLDRPTTPVAEDNDNGDDEDRIDEAEGLANTKKRGPYWVWGQYPESLNRLVHLCKYCDSGILYLSFIVTYVLLRLQCMISKHFRLAEASFLCKSMNRR